MSDPDVQLIVGLGNPGAKYENNRHNLGFWVVAELARRLGLVFRPEGAKYLAAGSVEAGDRLVLLMPLTYMNLSGEAVAEWSRATQVAVSGRVDRPIADLEVGPEPEENPIAPCESCESGLRPLVVCDDLNLPLGSVRLRPRGSSGGQNGLASVIEHLGGDEFPRLRLGVAPATGALDPADWPDYVLADFEPSELKVAEEMVAHAAGALEFWLENGLEGTISRFNRRVRPQADPPES